MKVRNLYKILAAIILLTGLSACDDFLDREPKAKIAPETYFVNASQMRSYCDALYSDILPSHGTGNTYGIFAQDAGTDNQTGKDVHNRFTSDLWKVPNKEGNNWLFTHIYKCNFFLANVLPRYGEAADGSANIIEGDLNEIKHYLGEMYFLRACEYFKRYQMFGDFPIITEPLPDNMEILTEASMRKPRNEVARFILADLDKAIDLLGAKTMSTIRIGKDAAILLKSRVALVEGTWLKYFKGTAFVPGGEGWPGAEKEYNAGYQYPTGSIDGEINYFLDIAMETSKTIAEAYKGKLTKNTGSLQQSATETPNPYYDMFAQDDLSSVSEVLLWRQYAQNLVDHNVNVYANQGNNSVGVTRAYVNNFLMADGTPVYTHGTYANGDGYYMGDKEIADVRRNRDSRLVLFLKEPGQKNILYENPIGTEAWLTEPYPKVTTNDRGSVTGYLLRKGASFNQKHYLNSHGFTASIGYRATEALLNYMEASYERNGTLDAAAREYWQIIRRRAHVSDDIDATIAATIMTNEAPNDWGAYSAGQLLTDATLYNIRRERRSELLAEGLRYMDLCRWRAMDQLMSTPAYHIEGFHLWGTSMESWYTDLVADETDAATVSSRDKSEYLRPYQKTPKQSGYNGLTWKMAHYLTPIMVNQFLLTASDGKSVETSPIYQNPYWPVEADQSARK
ncbi:RagB/SusD family nutrient uptake outer membrane protein [Bacteroides sp. 51]|uniref:RagB/SusD family nutrient uptake outer membrane protein n=1 Tax=Bacteroides sp. 51 TaxID=2302938 RepID=UPI0013D1B56B|nr:RagB/SusD family nutrient uptake outer membrane protein [Bacteroides sp. 51]NDV84384.1 RagB/SusD family nutrient uptake outer membrane protein [Bacteroides sp. 51]